MTAFRVIVLCLAAAIICSMVRVQRPEIATAISLAIGIGALLMTSEALNGIGEGLKRFSGLALLDNESTKIVLKAAGISVISELGVQICCDAGESSLAGRIRFSTRVVLLGMALPLVDQILESANALLP